MTDDNDVYTPAQYREHVDGFNTRDPVEHRHTGIVRDPRVSRYLSIVAENYDPEYGEEMPGTSWELSETQEIAGVSSTETGRKALENGDMPTLKHLTGDQNERADISGLRAIQEVDKIIEDPAPVLVIIGDMGTGKTDLGCLFGQRASHLLGIDKVASNLPTLQETDRWTDQDGTERDGFVSNFNAFEEWVEQDGDPLENEQSSKLFIADEFSSVGDGGGKSGYLMRKKMAPLVFKIRKYNGMLIYIGHDASSIHPLLWRVGYIVKKESEKKARVADKITNAEIRDIQAEIEGIPRTDWRYSTDDPAVWSWTDEDDEETPDPEDVAYDVAVWTAIRSEDQGLSSREAAKIVPFSHEWVNNRRKEQKKEAEHTARLDRVKELTA